MTIECRMDDHFIDQELHRATSHHAAHDQPVPKHPRPE